jgi:hypothetical protein
MHMPSPKRSYDHEEDGSVRHGAFAPLQPHNPDSTLAPLQPQYDDSGLGPPQPLLSQQQQQGQHQQPVRRLFASVPRSADPVQLRDALLSWEGCTAALTGLVPAKGMLSAHFDTCSQLEHAMGAILTECQARSRCCCCC